MLYAAKTRPFMYGLSTCGWCAKARAWLEQNAVDYELVYVDLLDDDTQERTIDELGRWADPIAFPVIIFGEEVVVGYRPSEYVRIWRGEPVDD